MSSSRIVAVVIAAAGTTLAVFASTSCSKSDAKQDPPSKPAEGAVAADHGLPPGPGTPTPAKGDGTDDRLHLQAEEGKLAITVPPDVKPGTEATANVTITPGTGYHVNVDYPVKLTLTPPSGVTLAKPELVKGDANAFDEQHLVFDVKLTAAQTGNYTVTGVLKFAVCTKDQCLPKKEAVSIAVAAK